MRDPVAAAVDGVERNTALAGCGPRRTFHRAPVAGIAVGKLRHLGRAVEVRKLAEVVDARLRRKYWPAVFQDRPEDHIASLPRVDGIVGAVHDEHGDGLVLWRGGHI